MLWNKNSIKKRRKKKDAAPKKDAGGDDHFIYLFIYLALAQIGLRSCEIKLKEKTPLSHEVVCTNFEVSKSNSWKITSFSKTIYVASSQNVLYYQQLASTRHQVWFYAGYYFE